MLQLVPPRPPAPLVWPPAHVWGAQGQWLALHHNDYEGAIPPDLASYAQVLWGAEEDTP